MAIILFFVAGRNNVLLNVLLLLALAAFCIHPLLTLPWVWAPASVAMKAWRVSLILVVVVLAVSRFGIWVWPSLATVAVPQVSLKTDSGLAASDFPSRTISAEMMRDLRRHRLIVANPNAVDVQDFVLRFQLPEPVTGDLVIEDRPAGVEIVWHACRMTFNLLGKGASTYPTQGGGTVITTAPNPGSMATLRGTGEGCSAAMDSKDLHPTGIYQLKVARLPARTAIRLAFVTSNGPEGERYLEAARNSPSDDSLSYFGDGMWHYLSGDHIETRPIFVPLRFDRDSRTITSEPSSSERTGGPLKPGFDLSGDVR